MEAALPGYGLLDYVAAAAWVVGLIGVALAKNEMRRNPKLLVRLGIASAVLFIAAPVVLLRRESIWWICFFFIVSCALSYGMWRTYTKVNK